MGREAEGVERSLCRLAGSALGVSATVAVVHSGASLRSTLTIAAMVFQLRVVSGTPYSRSSAPRNPMTFMWRLYMPMTNRFRLARIFINHWPLDGSLMGVDGVKRGRRDSTLTNRTTPGRTDCPSKGSCDSRLAISRPWQTTTSVANGSSRATAARARACVIGRRSTSVPAAPMLTAPRCFSASASLVGRKVLWPPTLTPLRNTTSATLTSPQGQQPCPRMPVRTLFDLAMERLARARARR
jgi:hypothetical protein